jgi:type VI secretion system secreted protein VgrG
MPRDYVEVRLESNDFSCAHVQIARMTGEEAISRLYRFDLEIVVLDPGEIDVDAATGAEVDLVFELSGAELRRIHAMVTRIDDLLDSEPAFRTYRLELAPRAFRLTMVETQEIFLDINVPDVIKQKLALVGLGDADVEFRLIGSYPKREFITQYKESDLAFVSRLSEHVGMSFFFEQHDGRDKMIFTDHPGGFLQVEREKPVVFKPRGDHVDVFQLHASRAVMPSAWVLQDYNYRTPLVDLTGSFDAPTGFAGGVVEHGAHHKTPDEGKAMARIRAEEREARTHFYTGASDIPELAAGAKFALEGHPRLPNAQPFLLVEVKHKASQVVMTAGVSPEPGRYENAFRAVDARKNFRPARVTPRPRINGVATALVEPNPDGNIGNIAQIDEQGRYTIKMYFDTAPIGGKPRSSHRVRMIQQHSGPNYGTHMPLKAGIEVLVVFVDGDPDRPLIVGSAPNPVTPTPVADRNRLMSRIKTASGIVIEMKDDF